VIASDYRGTSCCAGLLACTVALLFSASITIAATNATETAASHSRDEKSALAGLALQVVGQIQSQQQATLRVVEASQEQNAASIRSLTNRLRLMIVVGIVLVGGLVVLLLYIRAVLHSIQRRSPASASSSSVPHSATTIAARLTSLLTVGEALLDLKQPGRAIVCFDEVLALDERNAKAHVKRGAALEQLGRLDEALACYDQAIRLDASLADAYVGKGAVYNRLERYGEALECYEKAARLQPTIDIARFHSLH
jgi:tetratricopeptide (TPR) repeat protein